MATSRPRHTHLKLVPPPEAPLRPQTAALAYQNRLGETYYLHRGVTKTGKPRYFVTKTVGPGVLATLPKGSSSRRPPTAPSPSTAWIRP